MQSEKEKKRKKERGKKMFGIYRYSFGLQFTGLVAETEEAAWSYIEKTYSKEIDGILFHVDKDVFVVKKLELVEG